VPQVTVRETVIVSEANCGGVAVDEMVIDPVYDPTARPPGLTEAVKVVAVVRNVPEVGDTLSQPELDTVARNAAVPELNVSVNCCGAGLLPPIW
jgi:hypothetical protein